MATATLSIISFVLVEWIMRQTAIIWLLAEIIIAQLITKCNHAEKLINYINAIKGKQEKNNL